jgi:hypothetical protein
MAEGQSQLGAARRRQQKEQGPPSGIAPVESPSPKEAAAEVAIKTGPKHDDVGAQGLPAEFEFDLDYKDRRGYVWSGHFRAHILNITEQARVGLTKTRLAGGLNPVLLDLSTQNILEMQAHLAIALDESPPWAKNLHTVRDGGVLAAVYDHVARYEARFWDAEPGAGGGDDRAPSDAPAGVDVDDEDGDAAAPVR